MTTPPPPPHPLVSEEYNVPQGVTYRAYADGHVVAYAPEAPRDGVTGRTRWLATVWSAHPLLEPRRARWLRNLASDATWDELWRCLAAWESRDE